jgi:hypothetical protein
MDLIQEQAMDEDVEILPTRPVNSAEKVLREKFAESFAGQAEQMDKLGQQLITLELAIPGLYATVLKLTEGETATLSVDGWFIFTFGFWLAALTLTLIALVPRNWHVDPTILKPDPSGKTKTVDLETFFRKSAQYKRRLLIPAIVLFWLGILGAAIIVI